MEKTHSPLPTENMKDENREGMRDSTREAECNVRGNMKQTGEG